MMLKVQKLILNQKAQSFFFIDMQSPDRITGIPNNAHSAKAHIKSEISKAIFWKFERLISNYKISNNASICANNVV